MIGASGTLFGALSGLALWVETGTIESEQQESMVMLKKIHSAATTFAVGMILSLPLANTATAGQILRVADSLVNRSITCDGGNENAGHQYHFIIGENGAERYDHRFPDQSISFSLANGQTGTLTKNWSFETLSENKKSHLVLYERVSLRSATQNKHVYRTYDLYAQQGTLYMTLYDGVNGARDWKIKVTRDCRMGEPGNRIVRQITKRYWKTTFSR